MIQNCGNSYKSDLSFALLKHFDKSSMYPESCAEIFVLIKTLIIKLCLQDIHSNIYFWGSFTYLHLKNSPLLPTTHTTGFLRTNQQHTLTEHIHVVDLDMREQTQANKNFKESWNGKCVGWLHQLHIFLGIQKTVFISRALIFSPLLTPLQEVKTKAELSNASQFVKDLTQ